MWKSVQLLDFLEGNEAAVLLKMFPFADVQL